ncbi:MAG: alpha/beta fold hydrolase [Erysipelotrichaceae bacterium]|nr:alpha/beta fold hydrolase [Erysipelotrichaceae bacterium]
MKGKEVRIESGRNALIPATVFEANGKGGLLIMAHSFKSERSEDGRFSALAEILSDSGWYCIAPDFAGGGESDEQLSAFSLSSGCNDLEACYNYMLASYPIDQSRLALLGYSLGGRIISLFYGRHPEFGTLIFWASCNRPYSADEQFLQQNFSELLKQCDENGYCRFYDIYNDQYDQLSSQFIHQLLELDALKPLESFRGRALIIQGEKDQTIEPENARLIYEHLNGAAERKLHWMPFSDHGFGIFDGRMQDSSEIVSITASFLEANAGRFVE